MGLDMEGNKIDYFSRESEKESSKTLTKEEDEF